MENCEFMDAEYKRRRRLLGNIKFIGLLFKFRVIRSRIMFECFNFLLTDSVINGDDGALREEYIETFCHLFRQTAKQLFMRDSE